MLPRNPTEGVSLKPSAPSSNCLPTAFQLLALFDTFGPCANNKEYCLRVLDGTFINHPDADPNAVLLLEMMREPRSHQDKGPISCIPYPKENAEAWQRQKDITGVLSGGSTNAYHKCCSFEPNFNEIDCTIRTAPLEFIVTPKKVVNSGRHGDYEESRKNQYRRDEIDYADAS